VRVWFVMQLGLLLHLTACASGPQQPPPPPSVEEGLKELVNVYKYIEYSKFPFPRKPDDFDNYIDSMPSAYYRIKQGEFVVVWGIGLSVLPDSRKQILAYEKKAPTEGGAVLLRDGTVKTLSSEEFAGAQKAK
jgi:hypothetical protein